MVCFPQLSTGGLAQYPVVRRLRRRSVVNETPGGGRVTWSDVTAEWLEWELPLAGLTTEEWGAIEELFESSRGRAEEFVFLDPLDNLFGWSEDLDAAAWTAGPMLERTAGITDPLGTTRATRIVNTAQGPQRLGQTLGVPSWFHFCLSVWLRSASPNAVELFAATNEAEAHDSIVAGPEWREFWMSSKLDGTAENLTAGIELAPGAAVEVFGLQLQAQIGPSSYKRTAGRGGVYPAARFAEDLLRQRTDAIDWHSTTVRITSRREGA